MHPCIERGIACITTGLLAVIGIELPFKKAIVEAEEQIGVQMSKKPRIVNNVRTVDPCHDRHGIIYGEHGGRCRNVHDAITVEFPAIEFYGPAEKSVRGPIGPVRGQGAAIVGRVENSRIIIVPRSIASYSAGSFIETKFQYQVGIVGQRHTGPYLNGLRYTRDTICVHGEEHIIARGKKLPLGYRKVM